jgi:hypothetical protein
MFKDRHTDSHEIGPMVHDFLGYHREGEKRESLLPTGRERASYIALGEFKRWSEAITSLMKSWDEIPQAKEAKRGDLILYRYEGQIPNIHHLYFPAGVPIFDITAYPDKIDSVQKHQDKITSVTVTETHFTSFRNPMETFSAFKGSLSQMRKVGYLKDEKVVIQAPDFLLFDDINNFLTEKFKLQLPKMRQEMEPFRPEF